MMEQINLWLERLAAWLGTAAGVPEAQQMTVALGLLFVLATLLVIVVVVLLVRRRRPPEPPRQAVEEPPEADEPRAGAGAEETAFDSQAVRTEPEPAAGEAAAPPTGEAVAKPEEPVEEEPAGEPVAEPVAEERLSVFERMRRGLAKTQASLVGRVDALLGGRTRVDAELLEELEEVLITADLGMKTTQELIQAIEERLAGDAGQDPGLVRDILRQEMVRRLDFEAPDRKPAGAGPQVIMVVGVNGVGKTTTIGKLAKKFTDQGMKVVLGAGDTFRAAAAEQLEEWGRRSGVDVIRHQSGADPGAVAYDAVKAAVARKADILLLDTAGRLHTKVNLMEELKKVERVLGRELPGAPHETLLVLDATTGQNALVQARLFREAVAVSGVILTKLDGTARGGIVVAIAAELQLPVRYVGVGEKVDDLRPFDAGEFVAALFETGEKS